MGTKLTTSENPLNTYGVLFRNIVLSRYDVPSEMFRTDNTYVDAVAGRCGGYKSQA
jgi:hypothetical protein